MNKNFNFKLAEDKAFSYSGADSEFPLSIYSKSALNSKARDTELMISGATIHHSTEDHTGASVSLHYLLGLRNSTHL